MTVMSGKTYLPPSTITLPTQTKTRTVYGISKVTTTRIQTFSYVLSSKLPHQFTRADKSIVSPSPLQSHPQHQRLLVASKEAGITSFHSTLNVYCRGALSSFLFIRGAF